MNSATATSPPDILTQLGFEKLSQGASLFRPDNETEKETSNLDPTLVIICSWAFAQPRHIAKYIRPYQDFYPRASILLVQNVISNAIWKPDRWQMSFFQSAAAAIQAHISTTVTPRVLLHIFSNGGSHAAVQLSEACRVTCGGMKMPVDALLLDSCPGQPRFGPTINALVRGIPSQNQVIRCAATVMAYVSVGGTALLDILNISEPAAWKLYRKLNDPIDVFLLKRLRGEKKMFVPIPRTYLYSKADDMIMYDDILGHAQIANEKLLAQGLSESEVEDVVQLEEFIGTAHVNHVKTAEHRYWDIVRNTWTRRRLYANAEE